jgi:hypothetical protein
VPDASVALDMYARMSRLAPALMIERMAVGRVARERFP